MDTTPQPDPSTDQLQDAMRASLLSQGFDPAIVNALLAAQPTADEVYRVRHAVRDGLRAMQTELPASLKTWGPYLCLLVDGLPQVCPCSCPACAVGPCPCDSQPGHAPECDMPDGEPHPDCSERYTGVPAMPVADVTRSVVNDAAWWAERRGLKRTVARNVKRTGQGRPLLHSDGRGAREQFLQATRWLFTWLIDERRVPDNPAARLKLPPRQESPARSLNPEEFVEVYGVAVTTGRDPVLDGLILRHLLIQAVRRGGLLAMTCGGFRVESREVGFWDEKKKTWRLRPTTSTHLADLMTHALLRGPRVPAPPSASEQDRRHGLPALTDDSPVFYALPEDTHDEDGNFLSRVTHPITRKRIESLFNRIRRQLPWTERVELRCHDIRHTSGRMVYKAADQQAAKLHLAHDGGSTTDHYLKERMDELAKLKAVLFEPPTGDRGTAR